jgi:hypothetical protein
MKKVLLLCILLCLLALTISPLNAQKKTRVRFARGASHATLTGTIRGFAYKDYVVHAFAGQTIEVRLAEWNKCVFTVFNPDGSNLDIGADHDQFTNELPVTGDYVVRVLMMRNEARRKGSASSYKLTISIR